MPISLPYEETWCRQRWPIQFDKRYTQAQQEFRAVVRTWLEQHTPKGLSIPPDGSPLHPEVQERVKEFRRQLGSRGWLAPSWPKTYGGGGMGPALAEVIREELGRLSLPAMGDNSRWIPAMMAWGTEAQKQRFILPALGGETITWQAFNEPGSGSDLASIRTKADPDGNDFLLTGEKAFITGRFEPDHLWTLAVTGREGPPRLNLGLFMVDAHLTGITIKTQRLLAGSERRINFDNVRVPGDCLVGLPGQGWEIAQTILEEERGGVYYRDADDETVESIRQYLRQERG